MCKKVLFLISFVILAVPTLSADPVKVDLSQSGDVEPGWIDWNTGGVRLNPGDVSRQFLNEATFDDDFTIDFIKIDSRNRGQVSDSIPLHDLLDDGFKESDPFDMVIKNLAPAIYTITTYHHDENEDVVNDDGTINITVTDADGTRVVVDHLQQSWGPNPTFVGTAIFSFRSDGLSDVVITFEDNNDGIHNEAHFNGFELDILKEPSLASDPNPFDGATDVPRDVTLSWKPGIYAPPVNGHRVYLSANFLDVNDGISGITQDANDYTPAQRLDFGTTYYWRVDEVNAPPDSTVYSGSIWRFTTEPMGYPIDGSNIRATASSTGQANFGPEKTVDGSGLDENGLHSADPTDMWLTASEPQGAWIQYELDKVYKLHQMWVWNSNQVLEGFLGYGLKDVTVEFSADGTVWTTLTDVPPFAQAPGAAGYAHNTTVDFSGAVAKYVKLTATSNWGGILPQFSLSEVRFFSIPVRAREPSPDSGMNDLDPAVTFTWRAGREATTHNVYISSDQQAVVDGTTPAVSVTDTSYSADLDLANTYYWRIDEVNDAETSGIWQGEVWSFSTSDYLAVDDFESYNDIDPPDPESYRIFESWIDGYGIATNGALVGYDPPQPSYAETMIVHSGAQSMALFYGNTDGATFSEVARTFTPGQDWTKHGIQTLVLYFHGTLGNTGQLYLKVNGIKLSYPGDATDIAKPRWAQWNIDLGSLGVSLTNITTLAIGIDGNGAAGTLYVDDIVLYHLAPEIVVSSEEIWIEAEAADTISAPLQIEDDPRVSGGKYIGTDESVGNSNDSPPSNGVATYTFTVAGGTYKVSGRLNVAGGNSFWVRILGGATIPAETELHSSGWVRWDGITNLGNWFWEDVFSDDDNENATVLFTMDPGTYTLEIARREDGALLDVIVISKVD